MIHLPTHPSKKFLLGILLLNETPLRHFRSFISLNASLLNFTLQHHVSPSHFLREQAACPVIDTSVLSSLDFPWELDHDGCLTDFQIPTNEERMCHSNLKGSVQVARVKQTPDLRSRHSF